MVYQNWLTEMKTLNFGLSPKLSKVCWLIRLCNLLISQKLCLGIFLAYATQPEVLTIGPPFRNWPESKR